MVKVNWERKGCASSLSSNLKTFYGRLTQKTRGLFRNYNRIFNVDLYHVVVDLSARSSKFGADTSRLVFSIFLHYNTSPRYDAITAESIG